MIELLDAHLLAQLQSIKYGDDAITVYDYEPQRSHGETVYPCIAFFHSDVKIRMEKQRLHHVIYTASEEEDTVDVPMTMGGGEETGPVTYARTPLPIPIDLVYEVQTRSTKLSHAIALLEKILSVVPPGYSPTIGTQTPLFIHSPNVAARDELDLPLYCRTFLLTAHDVKISRHEATTHPAIKSIILEETAQFDEIGG